MPVAGCVALVTGANRGIGAAFVDALMAGGAAKVYGAVRDVASLAKAQQAYGDKLVPVALDVTDKTQVNSAARDCADLDLLVCNAGQTCIRPVLGASDDESAFRAVLEVNFFGPLHLLRAFAPALVERRGGIVFVLSTAAVALSRSAPVYSASKAAALMMTLGLREELRDQGVTVTNVFPGFVATDMSAKMTSPRAPALTVAEASLAGWLAGTESVFPDRYAQLVAESIGPGARQLLDSPRVVMNDLVHAFGADPLAGT